MEMNCNEEKGRATNSKEARKDRQQQGQQALFWGEMT